MSLVVSLLVIGMGATSYPKKTKIQKSKMLLIQIKPGVNKKCLTPESTGARAEAVQPATQRNIMKKIPLRRSLQWLVRQKTLVPITVSASAGI
jgi:hypothetical protein